MSKKKIKTNCPFWSSADLNCNIALDGLFIPPEDHVKMYCKTSDHPLCAQYSGQMSEEAAFYSCVAERRQYGRVFTAHQITIVAPGGNGHDVPSHFLATTVDLGKGGIRLFSKEPLSQDFTVNFAFDNSFPEHLQSGHATVKWCLPQLNSSGYQVGLAFKEEATSQEMSKYLSLGAY